MTLSKALLIVAVMSSLSASALAHNRCEDNFGPIQNVFDPRDPRAVLLTGIQPVPLFVQDQIARGLPESVRPIYMRRAFSSWVRDWFPLLLKNRETDQWRFVEFKAQTPHGRIASLQARTFFSKYGYEVEQVEVFLDWGNTVSDGKRVFISKSEPMLNKNRKFLKLNEDQVKERIEKAIGMEVVWLRELPREGTGHADMFMSYLGGNTFVVADSREKARKQMLDETAQAMKAMGYKVVRILNAGEDAGRSALSYSNSLIVQNRVLLPVYSSFVKSQLIPNVQRVLWSAFNSVIPTSLGRARLAALDEVDLRIANDDANAIALYESLGFEVVPILMNSTVKMDGMVHCLTRCLPQGALEAIPDSEW